MEFSEYQNRYRNIVLERNDGILEVRLHTDGGEVSWGVTEQDLHAELPHLFSDIARDTGNSVVIITGTGDSFIASMNRSQSGADIATGGGWTRIFREGVTILENLMAIPVPVIGAVNGPALVHAEIALLSDVVLAADTTVFADMVHAYAGVVPGDGVHTIWPMLLGPNRGRYFLMTGQRIAAQEALALGIVGEVMPKEDLLPRAREIARSLLRHKRSMLLHTRMVLTRQIRSRLRDEIELGLAAEGLALIDRKENG